MNRSIALTALALALTTGCASTEGEVKKSTASAGPRSQDDSAETPAPNATVSIASVQMIEDCPHQDQHDPGPPTAAQKPTADSPAESAHSMAMPISEGDVAPGAAAQGRGGGDFDQCTQSRLQLAFKSTGRGDANVKIKGARLLVPGSGKRAGELQTRKPQVWTETDGYRAWDEVVPNGEDALEAGYKLSVPEWSKVDAMIGRSSFGFMFVLEVDVEVDGVVETLRSPQFPREEPHIVVT